MSKEAKRKSASNRKPRPVRQRASIHLSDGLDGQVTMRLVCTPDLPTGAPITSPTVRTVIEFIKFINQRAKKVVVDLP